MPRGVKKTQEAEVASENNVTVVGEEKEPEKVSKSVTVEVPDEVEHKEDPKKSKVVESKKSDVKKSDSVESVKKTNDNTKSIKDKFYLIERPVPMYLAKNTASPLLAMVSGKCRIRSREGSWIRITIGVPEKGAVTGYILKEQAIIK